MSFLDCIRTAVRNGSITTQRGDAAEAAFNRHLASAIAEGSPEAQAVAQASLRAVDEISTMNSAKKWQRVNQLKVAHRISDRVAEAENIGRLEDYMIQVGNDLENSHTRIMGQAMALFENNLEAYRPRAVGIINPTKNMDEIVDHLYGMKVGTTAQELATEVANVQEFLRKQANHYGASIPENKNRRLPQMHDQAKLRRAGKTEAESRELWVQDHLEALDWEVMRYDGKPILLNERADVLGRVWDAITTDGYNRLLPGQTAAEHLATRMNRERFLYYKDADSWKAMNTKYGAGNVFEQMVTMMDASARDISTMEVLGPNPPAMIRYQQNLVRRRAADLAAAGQPARGKRFTVRADEALSLFERRYTIHSRSYMSGAENLPAQIVGAIRTVGTASMLQGAYIANLGDAAFIKDAAAMNGIPANGALRRYLRNFVPNRENRQWAVQSMLAFDSAIAQATNNNRFFGAQMGPAFARRISDTTFRATFLTQHNQAAKWAWGMQVMGGMAIYRKKGWGALPDDFRSSLERSRITEDDWNVMRSIEPDNFQGGEFLRPADLWNTGNLRNREVANKFMDYIHETGKRAVPESTTRTQQALGGHLDRNTLAGMAMQVVGVVKGFPITMHLMHQRDNWRWQTPGQRLKNSVRFFTYMTLAGAVITQLRELTNGRDPRDMRDPMFWLESAINGGSLGLLGDIFGSAFRGYGGLEETVSGPVVQMASRAIDLTWGNLTEAIRGEETNFAREVVQFGSQYGITGWQLRLMFRRMFAEELLREVDPAAYRRLRSNERRRERDQGNASWWGPGNATPERAPNMTNAIGG